MKRLAFAFWLGCLLPWMLIAQTPNRKTYCNPMNLDYGYCPIPNFSEQGRHRTTADPVIALYKESYYLFSTNQHGYWWSDNLQEWTFVARKFLKPQHKVYDELCAPAVGVIQDKLMVLGSTYTKSFPIWASDNPKVDDWHEAVDSLQVGAWDPAFFVDDDGRVFLYFGSSNTFPTYGQELDRKTLQPIGERVELLRLHPDLYGWERFGEHADNTFLNPFIEGLWMNKHKGKYYLQYAAPGTEFSGYGDGVYVGDQPLGPFRYQSHNPFSYKPGGFLRGAGHGATFKDKMGNWWHISTNAIGTKNNFERRLSVWPTGFDADGVMFTNTAYGDYPHYYPEGEVDALKSQFTGWMLLNYQKPVQVSSSLGGFAPNFAVDEDIKTYWSAATGQAGEWFQTDLGAVQTVRAVQINYADQDAEFLGKQMGIYHQYAVYASVDGQKWQLIQDKRRNKKDVPHDYFALDRPIKARFLKMVNHHMPTGKFALSGFRVFGKGTGAVPPAVQHFIGLRGDSERRNVWLKWQQEKTATGYTIYFGTAPTKLYNNVMVYNGNEYYLRALARDQPYYFQIEAFNENGIGERTPVMEVN